MRSRARRESRGRLGGKTSDAETQESGETRVADVQNVAENVAVVTRRGRGIVFAGKC